MWGKKSCLNLWVAINKTPLQIGKIGPKEGQQSTELQLLFSSSSPPFLFTSDCCENAMDDSVLHRFLHSNNSLLIMHY